MKNITKTKFISYGLDKIFKKIKYRPTKNRHRENWLKDVNKPEGLWACPVKAKLSWRNFVITDYDILLSSLEKSVKFKIKDNAKILILDSEEALREAYEKYPFVNRRFPDQKNFDWKKIKQFYDGVYVEISSLDPYSIDGPIDEYHLNCWDVDSICIWNLKKIKD